jgi:hypothetical protein
MNRWPFAMLFVLICASLPAQDAAIRVHPGDVISRPSRLLTGSCIEDVNHEIYGGIYSQMIFGESFQEPAMVSPVKGFTMYGGSWGVGDGVLSVARDPGAKLVADEPAFSTGEVGVELLLPGKAGGVAGLIVNVAQPGVGADKFVGYEVSLSSDPAIVRLGRHRQNWELIQDVPCSVPRDRWIALVVRVKEKKIEVLVDGRSVVVYEDREHPLPAGRIGLRTFDRDCRYRNLWVKTGGEKRSFALERDEPQVAASAMWQAYVRDSAKIACSLVREKAFAGQQSQRLAFVEGQGEVGLSNRGLNRWGMHFVEGKPYEGYVWARSDKPTDFSVVLQSGDGKTVYAQRSLRASSTDWRRIDFTLTPNGGDKAGAFAIALKQPGELVLGHVFLQPGAWGRFKGLPVRRDVVEGLLDQNVPILRYGGSMVSCAKPGEYRWKKMVGPRDRRPPYCGFWYAYSTNGWGIVDFLDLCEAMGIPGIPAFCMDELPEDMADFVEYVNGSAGTTWGKRRVADGHAAPYKQRYLQFGNEERIDANYARKFKAVAEAIWEKDPKMILVVGDLFYSDPISDPMKFTGNGSGITDFSAYREIFKVAKRHGGEVWVDIHLGTESPRDSTLKALPTVQTALDQVADGARWKLVVFELNSNIHSQQRALANALAIGTLQRNGRLPVVCSANCLQPDKQNENGWDQGLLFLNPSQVWLQPPGYAAQIISRGYLPKCVRADVQSPDDCLDVTATTSDDGKRLQLQVVNLRSSVVTTRIVADGFAASKPIAAVQTLAAGLGDANSAESPRRVVPKASSWRHGLQTGQASVFEFPAHSFTMLRIE